MIYHRLMITIPLLLATGFFISIVILACSGTQAATDHTDDRHSAVHDMSELEALYWERIRESRMNFVQADVDFMTDMIAHHAQALIMSRLAPENDASRTIQTLAARIINAQDGEIQTMQKWLSDRGQPVPVVHIEGLNLMIHMENGDQDHGHHAQHGNHGMHGRHDMSHHHDMPGMLTQEQLEELAAAAGREFDRKFLEFMIEHHLGAVIMVQELFAVDGAALDREAFELASGIKAEQVTEIERMRLMLDEMH
jgi:uncharacterized protein (DUF305 family)